MVKVEKFLEESIESLKKEIRGKAIIAFSGGVDSSYLAYILVKELGLKPLAVHLDNGWNSELAVKNIENIVNKLNIDLYTHVLDWDEFRKIQLAFFKSSVVDIELPSDFAISTTVLRVAQKYKLKDFIIGSNIVTESIMPLEWRWYKLDFLNIKDITRQYYDLKFKTFPKLSFWEYLRYGKTQIKNTAILDYVEYNKDNAKEIIKKELNWRDYGGKHHESKITEFYQKYILPVKFNIDKRKAHFSSLICAGQMTREEAEIQLEKPTYNKETIQNEIEYFCKKFEISLEEFNSIMSKKPVAHDAFKTYVHRKRKLSKLKTKIFR